MNILLNTQSLYYPLTGIGWYTRYLREGLQKHKLINQLICIPEKNKFNYEITKNFFLKNQLNKILKFFPGSYTALNAYRNLYFSNKTGSLYKKNFIYHEPCFVLRPYLGHKVCTIHDLSHLHYSEYHPKGRVKFLNNYLNLNNADQIITVSNFIRNELIKIFNIAPNKVNTIYHGCSKIFKPRLFNEIKKILLRYNLHEKSYLLSVGTLEPRKNLERLIRAFKQLPEQQRKKHPLVLVGISGWNTHSFEKLAQSLIKKEQLYFLGYIPKSDLPYLYSGAYGFIYISIYEGFGLPILEGMASGIPTLVSNKSAMPEVAGNAAILVNPLDIDAIVDKLNLLINDLELRDNLKKLGPLQAARFSWESCIEKTIEVYKKTKYS